MINSGFEDHKWAHASLEHLKELMNLVRNNYSEAKIKAKKGRQDIIQKFSPEVISKKISVRLNEIYLYLQNKKK